MPQPLRVLGIAPTVVPRSGWGRYAHSIRGEFHTQGVSLTLLSATPDPSTPKAPTLKNHQTIAGFLSNIFLTRKIARGVDVVHAFDIWPYGIYGYFAVLGTRKKLFLTGVATYSIAPSGLFSLKRLLMQRAVYRSSAVFSVSEYTKKRIAERLHVPNHPVVYWGASAIPSIPDANIDRYRDEFGIPHTRSPILLTVGEIKHRKGQGDVVRAVKRLKERYPNILYAMVGRSDKDAVYIQELETYIKKEQLENNVRIFNNVQTDEGLAFFYTISDIFLLTSNNEGSHFEGFGLVFLEAEQFGKPVIGTKGCGVEEAQEPGYNGYLVAQGDDADIAEKIQMILEGDARTWAEHSKEFASRFTWKKTASEYIQYYQA